MVKIASNWWRNDQVCQKEKKIAQKRAQEDLAAYERIMENYHPPSQEELRLRLKEMPKRFRTSWNFFVMDKFRMHYKKLKSFGPVVIALSKKWRTLSEAQVDHYHQKYLEDRERYRNEMEIFKAKHAPHLFDH